MGWTPWSAGVPTSSAGASSAVASSSDTPTRHQTTAHIFLRWSSSGKSGTGGTVSVAKNPFTARGAAGRKSPVPAQDLRELLDRPHRRAGDDGRSDRVRAELELRDDAEVPAAAAQRPEQLRVLVGARVHLRAVGQHDVGADEAVDGQAEAAREVADAAAEREPADAGRGDDARRGRAAVLAGRRVDLGPRAAAAHADGLGCGVDDHVVETAEVDDDRVVGDAEAAAVVAAAAHRDALVVSAGEGERARDVLRARADHDRGGVLVDHAVVDGAGVVVAGVAGADDAVGQLGQVAACDLGKGGGCAHGATLRPPLRRGMTGPDPLGQSVPGPCAWLG